MIRSALPCLLAMMAAPALALAPSSVAVVNGTGAALSNIEIRDAAGGAWTSVGGGVAVGRRVNWSFDDSVCAYDVRATLGGGKTIEVRGINPCDAKLLTLKLNAGTGWVDYD